MNIQITVRRGEEVYSVFPNESLLKRAGQKTVSHRENCDRNFQNLCSKKDAAGHTDSVEHIFR